jgi:WD40 repeat protein
LKVLRGHEALVHAVAFSPSSAKIATGDEQGTVKLWSVRIGHSRFVGGLDYSPDGRRLATASLDGTAKVWAADSGQELLTLDEGIYRIGIGRHRPPGRGVV